MTWDGVGYPGRGTPFRSGDPVIGESGDRKSNAHRGARRRGEQPSQAGVELGIPGIELFKPFRILDEVGGGGVATADRVIR